MNAAVTAVVPLRDGVSGKSRLASVLDDDARRALITVLAQHVVGTLLATPQVRRVVVVTADLRFARSALGELSDVGDLDFLAQPPDRPGLNGALDAARDAFGSRMPGVGLRMPGAGLDGSDDVPGDIGAAPGSTRAVRDALLVAHADLPALTPDDIADLVMRSAGHSAARRTPDQSQGIDVVIGTDRVGRGTNLLLLGAESAERGFRFRFGSDSRAAHEGEAARLGLRAETVSRPGTAVDLDTVDDWNELPAEVRAAVGRYAPFPSG